MMKVPTKVPCQNVLMPSRMRRYLGLQPLLGQVRGAVRPREAEPVQLSAAGGLGQPLRRTNFWKQWGVSGASRRATPVATTTSPT